MVLQSKSQIFMHAFLQRVGDALPVRLARLSLAVNYPVVRGKSLLWAGEWDKRENEWTLHVTVQYWTLANIPEPARKQGFPDTDTHKTRGSGLGQGEITEVTQPRQEGTAAPNAFGSLLMYKTITDSTDTVEFRMPKGRRNKENA